MNKCPKCGSTNIEPLKIKYGLHLYNCNECSWRFVGGKEEWLKRYE